ARRKTSGLSSGKSPVRRVTSGLSFDRRQRTGAAGAASPLRSGGLALGGGAGGAGRVGDVGFRDLHDLAGRLVDLVERRVGGGHGRLDQRDHAFAADRGVARQRFDSGGQLAVALADVLLDDARDFGAGFAGDLVHLLGVG